MRDDGERASDGPLNRQPRYPLESFTPEDRRLCVPALRRVCQFATARSKPPRTIEFKCL